MYSCFVGPVKFHRPYNNACYFAVNAPPNKGWRNTPTPISENNTAPVATTATAATMYLMIFFINYKV